MFLIIIIRKIRNFVDLLIFMCRIKLIDIDNHYHHMKESDLIMKKFWLMGLILLTAILLLGACSDSDKSDKDKKDNASEDKKGDGEVNLYTGRHYDTDEDLYKKFTKETGVKVNVIKGDNDELIARLEREGKGSEADVFITADAGRLHSADEKGLLQEIESKELEKNIPEKYRDDKNKWFGLTKRARIIAYDKEKVEPEEVETYEDVTKDRFNKELLIRSSDNVYNQSIVASFIALNGEKEAKKWAQGVVDNMARSPKGGDTDQAIALAAGEGEIAVMNSYYYGRMLNDEDAENKKAAKKLEISFPNQDSDGTHVNISGAGVTTSSKNKDNAVKFIEFLSQPEQQEQFSSANFEYPTNSDVEPSKLLKSWGEFKEQDLDLNELGENNAKAVKIMNEVGWK